MKVLKHGKYYNENKEIECVCGCKYQYDDKDIIVEDTIALTTNPQQYQRYVICPECRTKTYISTTFTNIRSNYDK